MLNKLNIQAFRVEHRAQTARLRLLLQLHVVHHLIHIIYSFEPLYQSYIGSVVVTVAPSFSLWQIG